MSKVDTFTHLINFDEYKYFDVSILNFHSNVIWKQSQFLCGIASITIFNNRFGVEWENYKYSGVQ